MQSSPAKFVHAGNITMSQFENEKEKQQEIRNSSGAVGYSVYLQKPLFSLLEPERLIHPIIGFFEQ